MTQTMDDEPSAATRTRVMVCMTTHRRNDALRRLLDALVAVAEDAAELADVGVVVVDDNPDGRAESVVKEFVGRYPLDVHYRFTGAENISIGRNAALEAGIELGDWILMTDDDCEPPSDWVVEMLSARERFGADIVTGPRSYRSVAAAPSWYSAQRYHEDSEIRYPDGSVPDHGCTANVLLSCAFLRTHPDVRFQDALGRLGGEDMVFFHAAENAGANHRFSETAITYEYVPLERTQLRSLLRTSFWYGNNEAVINERTHEWTRWRLLLRGTRRAVEPQLRLVLAAARRDGADWRGSLYDSMRGLGLVVGAFGVRINHH